MPLVVEALADPTTQAGLTGLGFDTPGPSDRYVVLEAVLEPSAAR